MNTNEKEKRKRKDPQSRQYLCKCGKGYLSYAAAYTHVKNKHNLEKDFVDNIKKPEREQLKRGRPKEKKQNSRNLQTTLLTLIESTILKICNEIDKVFDRIILEGNQEQDQNELDFYYDALCKQKSEYLSGYDLQLEQQMQNFIKKLNKDFKFQIAGKIRLVGALLCLPENKYLNLQRLNQLDLWNGCNKVNDIICQAYDQWSRLKLSENVIENEELNGD